MSDFTSNSVLSWRWWTIQLQVVLTGHHVGEWFLRRCICDDHLHYLVHLTPDVSYLVSMIRRQISPVVQLVAGFVHRWDCLPHTRKLARKTLFLLALAPFHITFVSLSLCLASLHNFTSYIPNVTIRTAQNIHNYTAQEAHIIFTCERKPAIFSKCVKCGQSNYSITLATNQAMFWYQKLQNVHHRKSARRCQTESDHAKTGTKCATSVICLRWISGKTGYCAC